MKITLSATMKTPEDAEAFNQLSLWCIKRTLHMDATINGQYVAISVEGNAQMMKPLVDYLTDKKYGV